MQKPYLFTYSFLGENLIINVLKVHMNLKKISAFSILDNSEISILNKLMETKNFRKGEDLIKQGKIADDIILLSSGIVSSIYTIGSKKFIRDFYFSPLIFTEQESFVNRVDSKFSVTAITNIECKLISYNNLEDAYKKIPRLRDVAYELLMNGFINISARLESLLTLNPEDRYRKLLNENPKLLHEIPLKMIASYLGITDVALSRIRKRISVQR